MINRLAWMETDNMYLCRNPAMEECITLHVPRGTHILYLRQNRHTVVIGKNQNYRRECRMSFLEQKDDYLVRRLSGGDAMSHDLGNLNSIFIIGAEDYDVSRQLDVVPEAVKSLGIHVEETGCSDITVEGHKFSGNAFYRTGDDRCHHDTILIWMDRESMPQYLNVSKKKLVSKDVTSVKSRAANLYELKSDIMLEEVKTALVEAFSRVYGQPAVRMRKEELLQLEIDIPTEKSASWQWEYGRKTLFEYEMEKRFLRGNIQVQLHVDEDVMQDMNIFSDIMGQKMFGALARQPRGCDYTEEGVRVAVETVGPDAFQAEEHAGTDVPQSRRIRGDIRALMRGSL